MARISCGDKVLSLYVYMRDDHGIGRKKGLQVIEIGKKFHWKKQTAAGALQRAKEKGRELERPLIIAHDIVRETNEKGRVIAKHVHYIPANETEARDFIEGHHKKLAGAAIAHSERLDILSEQHPKLVYTPVQRIGRRLQLFISVVKGNITKKDN